MESWLQRGLQLNVGPDTGGGNTTHKITTATVTNLECTQQLWVGDPSSAKQELAKISISI